MHFNHLEITMASLVERYVWQDNFSLICYEESVILSRQVETYARK